MTKNDMLKKLDELLTARGMSKIETFAGKINGNNDKQTIQGAIDCLECDDKTLDDYMVVFRLKFPNSYNAIMSNGTDWKKHSHNRFYVYNTARMILSD